MRRSFKIVKMDLTQHEKTVGNHGNMREVYIVHGQVLQLPDSGNMLRVPTMAGCSYPDSSVLHQRSTDLCLGEFIFFVIQGLVDSQLGYSHADRCWDDFHFQRKRGFRMFPGICWPSDVFMGPLCLFREDSCPNQSFVLGFLGLQEYDLQ